MNASRVQELGLRDSGLELELRRRLKEEGQLRLLGGEGLGC